MGSGTPLLPDDLREFIRVYWDTDTRLTMPSSTARSHMRKVGIEGAVRRYLTSAILRGAVSPEAWSKLFNAQTYTPQDVRRDATEFWKWLYDGAPPPSEGGGSGAVQPPQV